MEQGVAVSLTVDAAKGHIDADEIALSLKGGATEINLLFDPDDQ